MEHTHANVLELIQRHRQKTTAILQDYVVEPEALDEITKEDVELDRQIDEVFKTIEA